MNEYIFNHTDYENDPEWVFRDFFNSMNLQSKFMWMLPYLIYKIGCGVNEIYCSFPDLKDPGPECHFEGIMFGVWEGEVIFSEKVGFEYVRLACENYVKLHPEDTGKIKE